MKSWGWVGDGIEQLYDSRGITVALDTETTGLDFQDSILGVSLAWRDYSGRMRSAYLFAPVGQMSLDAPMDMVGELDIEPFLIQVCDNHEIVFFNEAFDTRALFRICPDILPGWTHDCMHMAGLIDAQEERNLEWIYRKYVGSPLPGVDGMKKRRKSLWMLPLSVVAPYARSDAVGTLELYEKLYKLVGKKVNGGLYESDRQYALIVMNLIRDGLTLDFSWCQEMECRFVDRMLAIEAELRPQGLMDIGSNHAVASFLFKTLGMYADDITSQKNITFPDGVPSVSADVLEGLMHSDAANKILEHRQLRGAIGKYLRKYREHAKIDGKVHSLLDPFGTVSSRIAASHPNVTAIAMEDRDTAFGAMNGIFVADNDTDELWSMDFSQMEVRVAAVRARENALIAALNSDRDPYKEMSNQIWGTTIRRNDAKRALLATIYEIGPDAFADNNNVTVEEAREILYPFRASYPKIKLASNLAMAEVKREGCVTAYTGRSRWFGEWEEEYKAFNQEVQTDVAEIMRDAMLAMDTAYPGRMKLQIHDSIIASLPGRKQARADLISDMEEIMRNSVPPKYRDVVRFPVKSSRWQLKGHERGK